MIITIEQAAKIFEDYYKSINQDWHRIERISKCEYVLKGFFLRLELKEENEQLFLICEDAKQGKYNLILKFPVHRQESGFKKQLELFF